MPVQSPIAQTFSAARRRSSVSIPRFVISTPELLEPEALRRSACGRWRRARSSVRLQPDTAFGDRSRRGPSRSPPPRTPPASDLRRVGVHAREQPLVPLDDRHLRAEPPVELGQLAAGDAAADHDQARRHLVRGGRVVRSSRRRSPSSSSAGDGDEPVATTSGSYSSSCPSASTTPGRATRPSPRTSVDLLRRRATRPGRVVPVARSPSRARRRSPRGRARSRRRPACATPRAAAPARAAASSTACTRSSEHSPPTSASLDERDLDVRIEPPQRAAEMLPGGAPAQYDHARHGGELTARSAGRRRRSQR